MKFSIDIRIKHWLKTKYWTLLAIFVSTICELTVRDSLKTVENRFQRVKIKYIKLCTYIDLPKSKEYE